MFCSLTAPIRAPVTTTASRRSIGSSEPRHRSIARRLGACSERDAVTLRSSEDEVPHSRCLPQLLRSQCSPLSAALASQDLAKLRGVEQCFVCADFSFLDAKERGNPQLAYRLRKLAVV